MLTTEDRWTERGVTEAFFVKVEQPSWHRGGGLWHQTLAARHWRDFNDSEAQNSPELNNSDGSSELVIHSDFPAQNDFVPFSISDIFMQKNVDFLIN